MLKCVLFGFFVLVVLFLVPHGERLYKSAKTKRQYKYTLFTTYLVGILWLTLINRWGMEVSRVRFEPFYVLRFILNCWLGWKRTSAYACAAAMRNSKNLFNSVQATPIEDLLLNIILFIPLGFLLPYLWPKLSGFKTVLTGLLVSVAIETTQYVLQLGCCDIDDIINNTLGSLLGYVLYRCWSKLNLLPKEL